jgi:hypothetical protein
MDAYKSKIAVAANRFAMRRAARKGELNFRHAYVLNCIANVLKYSCNLNVSQEELRVLNMVYFQFYSASPDLPSVNKEETFEKSTIFKKLEIQDCRDSGMNAPVVDNYEL